MITPDSISYGDENEQISEESKFSKDWKNRDIFYDTIKDIKDDTSWIIFSLPNIKKWNIVEQIQNTWFRKIIPIKELNYEKALKVLGEYIKFDETFEKLKKWDLIINEKKGVYYIEWGEYMINFKIPDYIVEKFTSKKQ